ncbi:MAG TPA: hypothetical protein VFV73_02355 [Streptosporangiaceae bacterium]|nr:hypothetical protein [Streptosporangiaceae bacterium]
MHLSARLRPSLGAATGLVLGLLALGPGLRRGFLLSYDMVFVPREPFTSAMFGLSGGPPRAVPSDFVVAVASRLLPADIVQKLVLLLIFVLACSGVAALLDREPALARLAAAVFYAWNPYVAERLIIGQWALLIGYAGLPWVLRAGLALGRDSTGRGAARLVVALLPAIVSGFASMAISALVLVPVALASRNARAGAITLAALAAGSLPWLIPSLLHAVYADPGGVAAFASRADTPFGTVGSLVMLGGMWNADTVPKGYGGPWSAIWLAVVLAALAGYVLIGCGRPRREQGREPARWPGLTAAALVSLAIACIGITEPGRALLRGAIRGWPAFAILRDAQQFIAPLALAEAIGFGLAVTWCVRPRPFGQKIDNERGSSTPPSPAPPELRDPLGLALGLLALVTPLLLLPGLAWGAAGRLRPAWYPDSFLAAARAIDASPAPGAVLLLPWAADRTPAWNHGEVMLDAWPRLVSRQVIWNDGTIVGNIGVGSTGAGNLALAPDDPAARRLDRLIVAGGPMTAALRAAGVRFVVVDGAPLSAPDPRDARDTPAGARLPGAVRLYNEPELVVYQLPR